MGDYVLIFRHRSKTGQMIRITVEPLETTGPEAAHEAALSLLKEVFETSSQRAEIRREDRTRVFADTLGPAE